MFNGEHLLRQMNAGLAPLERNLIRRFKLPSHPVVFVMGSGPRCGHTLLSQLLAASGAFGYINNFVARFWNAPLVGAFVDRFSQRFHGERVYGFNSEYGRTKGLAGPHEFGFFVRRFLHFEETHCSSADRLSGKSIAEFRKELAALEKFFDKPIFLRNIVFGLNIDILNRIFPNSIFVYCIRNPLFQAQSIYLARLQNNNDPNIWWSLRPREYLELKKMPIWDQIIGQIHYTDVQVNEDLVNLDSNRWILVSYEDICNRPLDEIIRVLQKLERLGVRISWSPKRIPERFKNSNKKRIPDDQYKLLLDSYEKSFERSTGSSSGCFR